MIVKKYNNTDSATAVNNVASEKTKPKTQNRFKNTNNFNNVGGRISTYKPKKMFVKNTRFMMAKTPVINQLTEKKYTNDNLKI